MIIELLKVASGITALVLLVMGTVVLGIVVGTVALIARDRIEDAFCAARRNRRRRRGRL